METFGQSSLHADLPLYPLVKRIVKFGLADDLKSDGFRLDIGELVGPNDSALLTFPKEITTLIEVKMVYM